jgi:hypothetical protein
MMRLARRFHPATLVAGGMLVPVALSLAGIIPTVRFTRERIEVTVHPDSINVDGLYVYTNPLPIALSQGLRVPFSTDTSHPAPATVEVREVDPATGKDLKAILVRWFWREPYFSIRVPAFGAKHVRVRFTQYSPTGSATYLLTTTKPWGRPLEQGEYVLRPRGVRMAASNYPLDGQGCICFARQHFMPDRDWSFTWLPQ